MYHLVKFSQIVSSGSLEDIKIKPYSDSDKTYEEAVEEAIKYTLTHKLFES